MASRISRSRSRLSLLRFGDFATFSGRERTRNESTVWPHTPERHLWLNPKIIMLMTYLRDPCHMCLWLVVFWLIDTSHTQEPITRSLQLPHIPVMAFSQIDLFIIQILTWTSVTNCDHKHGLMLTCRHHIDMFTWGHIVLSSPKRAHVDWNWPISREKYLKIDWSVKMPLHWLMGSWHTLETTHRPL